jgi:subtilisin family serine protease
MVHSGPLNEIYAGKLMIKVHPSKGAANGAGSVANPLQPILAPADEQRISQKLGGAKFVNAMPHNNWTLWTIPASLPPATAVSILKGDPSVAYAEPLNRVYALDLPVPNDADWDYIETDPNLILDLNDDGEGDFLRLWHLWDTNAVTDDSTGFLMGGWAEYPGTWYTAQTKPLDCPLLAIIDTGADWDHPDYINAGGTGSDVTQGGQINKSLSSYFTNGLPDNSQPPLDQNGHGTHVTGLAIAAGNNGSFDGDGVIGMGYNSQAMILRVFDNEDNSTDQNAAGAIYYAADHGADVINLSLGTTNYSQVFQDAVTYAWQKGVLLLCAGNENGNGGGNLGPIYPAACSGSLAVTANAPGLYPADDYYAGYGYYVGIASPGGDLIMFSDDGGEAIQYVFSTSDRSDCTLSEDATLYPPYTLNYSYLVGTSMATPSVTGAAGLYYGQQNMHQMDGYSNLKAFWALEQSAMATNSVANGAWEPTQGYGSLDVNGLLDIPAPNPRGAVWGSVYGIVYYGGTPLANVRVTATPAKGGGIVYQTTTEPDGTYRFDGMPGGLYDVTAVPFGASKTKRTMVAVGADHTGVDFFCGPPIDDSTPPVIQKFNFVGTGRLLDIDQWAYDTESELDSIVESIGTTPGGHDVSPATIIAPTTSIIQLGRVALPSQYFVTVTYTNGVGLSSVGSHAVTLDTADAYVKDGANSGTNYSNSQLLVTKGGSGSNSVAYLTISLAGVRSVVSTATLALTGSASSPVSVGLYATNNAAWTQSGIDWNNAPAISGSSVEDLTVSSYNTYTWNIESLVQKAIASGATSVTIAVKCDTTSGSGATFSSSRGTAVPHLTITSHD